MVPCQVFEGDDIPALNFKPGFDTTAADLVGVKLCTGVAQGHRDLGLSIRLGNDWVNPVVVIEKVALWVVSVWERRWVQILQGEDICHTALEEIVLSLICQK